ncbi:hypothetical protein J2T58_001338 [Methanocalculus alkaliphilus]|nr:hypothetical protein [Methanocalculus alkaliphilus]
MHRSYNFPDNTNITRSYIQHLTYDDENLNLVFNIENIVLFNYFMCDCYAGDQDSSRTLQSV